MDKNRIQDENRNLKRELSKTQKELKKANSREMKYKSDLKDVRKALCNERKKKDVTQVELSEKQELLISNLLPGILTRNS